MPDQSTNTLAGPPQTVLGGERRSEPRYPTEDPVQLEFLAGPRDSVHGIVLDVSRSGMRIAVPESIERGALVKLKLQSNVIYGEVRYCRRISGHFDVGIQIQELLGASGHLSRHVAVDLLSLYATGKGLSLTEIIEVREHVGNCDACRASLSQKQALLGAAGRPRPHSPVA